MPDDRIKEWIRDRRREQNKIAKRRSRQRQKAKRLNTLEDSGVTLLDTSSTSLASSQTALTRWHHEF
ncbi:hypothetical protein IFM46972_10787 [Aspergillus udagawae]|uniref:BZIP domain-containing protein n=1 Tax=Aspergillus udagawae TaxID=91492 RepID=A0A8H3SEG9_9EURO|nr:hypothetical protein IFM46972_10787 [Aspergillus udagawae]